MKADTLQFYKERMLRVLVHLEARLEAPPRLSELARVACLSPYHFHRVFTGMLGESVMSHLRRLRLERAASRLKLGRQGILPIALEAGYRTHESFTRAFRANFGLSPSQFRRAVGVTGKIAAASAVHYQPERVVRGFRARRPQGAAMSALVKHLNPLRVAFMRHTGPYSTCGRTWDALLMELGRRGLIGGSTLFIGICHDDPEVTPPEWIRYDACVTVDTPVQPRGAIGIQTIAEGRCVQMLHVGPYERVGASVALMRGFAANQGLALAGPHHEIYLSDPRRVEPERLKTILREPTAEHGAPAA